MALTLRFHNEARREFLEAITYYEKQRKGLGQIFNTQINNVLKTISETPLQFPIVLDDNRKAIINSFPFIIVFTIWENTVYILAIFHTSRNPDDWKERIV